MNDRYFSIEIVNERTIFKINNTWRNPISYEYGLALIFQFTFTMQSAKEKIDQIAIIGNSLFTYHTAILLRSQGYNVIIYETELTQERLNQVWFPLRNPKMTESENERFDLAAKSTYDTYQSYIEKNVYFGLKKCKVDFLGSDDEIAKFIESNIPASLQLNSTSEFILIESQFYNELRHECHSMGIIIKQYQTLNLIPNKYICIAESQIPKHNVISNNLKLSVIVPEQMIIIPQKNGVAFIGESDSVKQAFQLPSL